jgi:hypothetical protein
MLAGRDIAKAREEKSQGLAGLLALWLARWPGRTRVAVIGWVLGSVAALCPGFYFRPHYFILLLPSVGLLAGVLAASIAGGAGRWFPRSVACALAVVPLLGATGLYVAREHAYLVSMPPDRVSREVYRFNPFIEAREVAQYIQAHTTPDDRIAVLGSEPEIYFLANRTSATGYLYMYALMEAQPYASRMAREMMDEIDAAHPAYLVVVSNRFSWNFQPQSDRSILTSSDRYAGQCYMLVGVVDTISLRDRGTLG